MNGRQVVLLQPRDYGLLLDLYEKTVMSLQQIHNGHFSNCIPQTVSNRMRKLFEGGFVTKYPVGIFIFKGQSHKVGVVFSIKGKGLVALRSYYPRREFRSSPLPVHSSQLIHDLLLNDVVESLKRRWPDATWTNGKYLGGEEFDRSRVPDAVFKHKDGEAVTSIELELTAKSETRYRHLVLDYQLNRKFENVIFVCANALIFRKIASVVTANDHFQMSFGQSNLKFGKFELVLLESQLCNKDPKSDAVALKLREVAL